jgi:hypothetical protein
VGRFEREEMPALIFILPNNIEAAQNIQIAIIKNIISALDIGGNKSDQPIAYSIKHSAHAMQNTMYGFAIFCRLIFIHNSINALPKVRLVAVLSL